MTPEQRRRRMLSVLPLLLQEGANVGELFHALATVLSGTRDEGGMEYGVTRVLRSRWHALAEVWDGPVPRDIPGSELARLAALYGFAPARGEASDRFRRRLLEFVAIHRAGLTTASAILRLVALAYEAEETLADGTPAPKITWEAGNLVLTSPETAGRIVAVFRARDSEDELREVRVELLENPTAQASAAFSAVIGGKGMLVVNAGLDPAVPEIRLKAVGADVHVPVLKHVNTGQHLVYVGVVEKDRTLTLRHNLAPLIDGVPQDNPVLLTNPFTFNAPNSLFVDDSDIEHESSWTRFSLAKRDSTLPDLSPGENAWVYDTLSRVEVRAFLGAWPDLVDLELHALETKAATTVDAGFRWLETVPASIALRVPASVVPRSFAGDLFAFVRELERVLHYGRAAGVRARVELALPHIDERLTVSDHLTFEAGNFLAEDQPVVESAPPPEIGILLHDTVPMPVEAPIFFDGHFNATYFDTSLFAEPETEP